MSEFDVGARLKDVREANQMSQRELATQSGVTNGLISLIERNKTSPSISSLKRILAVFDMSLSDFFEAPDRVQDKFVFRHAELTEINPARIFQTASGDGLQALSLKRVGSGGDESTLLMLYETYEPGADTGPELYAHEGEESGYVISGELLLTVGDRTEVLQAGDAYQFSSRIPHRFRNVGAEPCVIVSACTPPSF
ncbi:cupin domain-containing protein [Thioclava sp. A2]|uniref:cupin domain-containing protein n=1 Tax=Thioclava sp. FCG-A2 TaxID=3080562 RepID=UPI0029531F44|nr:cupin domain-containing protein [Thioclava sp. A2]